MDIYIAIGDIRYTENRQRGGELMKMGQTPTNRHTDTRWTNLHTDTYMPKNNDLMSYKDQSCTP